jgi:polar amino acid transport system substrate-binding protein
MDVLRRRLLSAAGLSALSASAASEPVCRVVGSHDPPFRLLKGGAAPGGLYLELLAEAARRADWRLRFEEVPAARALLMLEQGTADLSAGPLRLPERERYLHYSRISLPPEEKIVLTRQGASAVRGPEDLHGLRVGVHRGKRYGEAFDALVGLQRVELPDYSAALRMLALGRLDAVLLPRRQAQRLLDELKLREKLQQQPWRLAGATPYVVLSRRSPWLARLSELETAAESLQRDGFWSATLARYADAT